MCIRPTNQFIEPHRAVQSGRLFGLYSPRSGLSSALAF
jgi:hypothetical protein